MQTKISKETDFPGGPEVKTLHFQLQVAKSSIPGQEVPHAMRERKKRKKKKRKIKNQIKEKKLAKRKGA